MCIVKYTRALWNYDNTILLSQELKSYYHKFKANIQCESLM